MIYFNGDLVNARPRNVNKQQKNKACYFFSTIYDGSI